MEFKIIAKTITPTEFENLEIIFKDVPISNVYRGEDSDLEVRVSDKITFYIGIKALKRLVKAL